MLPCLIKNPHWFSQSKTRKERPLLSRGSSNFCFATCERLLIGPRLLLTKENQMITKSDLNRLLRTACDHPVWMSSPLSGVPLVRQQVAANALGLEYMDLHLHNGFAIWRAMDHLTPNDSTEFSAMKNVVLFDLNCAARISSYFVGSILDRRSSLPEGLSERFKLLAGRDSYKVTAFLHLDALQKRLDIRNSVRSLMIWKKGFDPLDNANGQTAPWEKLIADLDMIVLTRDVLFKVRSIVVDRILTFLNQDAKSIPPLTCCGLNIPTDGQRSPTDHS
jgi:hypothetical protein